MTIKQTRESEVHRSFIQYLLIKYPDIEFFHIPNGEKRSKITGKLLKLLGVKAGVPDLYFPKLHLWFEIKKEGGRLTKEQKSFLERRKFDGDHILVGYGFTHCMTIFNEYLNERY